MLAAVPHREAVWKVDETRWDGGMDADRHYPTDLTVAQWAVLAPLVTPPKPGGRPRRLDMRPVLDARLLHRPDGMPVALSAQGVPELEDGLLVLHPLPGRRHLGTDTDALRRWVRQQVGRDPEPSAAVLDGQSVKTTESRVSAATMPASR
jgi:putative transposase